VHPVVTEYFLKHFARAINYGGVFGEVWGCRHITGQAQDVVDVVDSTGTFGQHCNRIYGSDSGGLFRGGDVNTSTTNAFGVQFAIYERKLTRAKHHALV
jgi:hypothetical protein